MKPWLSVVGIGEDGLDGLSPAARALIDTAEVLIGGERHLAKVPQTGAERLTWGEGFAKVAERIAGLRPSRVAVLASGDPFDYGVGALLARRFATAEMTVIPVPGAFSLAAARMGWSRPDIETLTLHGRPLEALNLHLAPGARLLALSKDGDTPAQVAELLRGRGFATSPMTVFEHLGGEDERRLEGAAADWPHPRAADLNVIAIECRAGPGAIIWPRLPGLPEAAFEHDGKITKREVRAAAIAKLMVMPGQVLWDVGAGSGSVAIEWMRAERTARAVAIERHGEACARIARNASGLGVPGLKIVEGRAPGALDELEPDPDAIFLGGGIGASPGLLEACLDKLGSGGRLVANAVTVEAEQRLLAFRNEFGGELTRLSLAHAEPVGRFTSFKPLITVTQYALLKS